jgi:hypothetical protein
MRKMIRYGIVLFLLLSPLQASVEEYQKIQQEVNQQFNRQMSKAIKANLSSQSKEIQDIYKAIGYKPVWVTKESLSANAVLLMGEIEDDLANGALLELKQAFEALKQNESDFVSESSFTKKLQIELETMQLYIDHIHAILKGTNSMLTPQILLVESLKKGSLVHGFNAISKQRTIKRTPTLEENETILCKKITLDENLTKALTKGSDKARLKKMYQFLNYQPVWISEKGYSTDSS